MMGRMFDGPGCAMNKSPADSSICEDNNVEDLGDVDGAECCAAWLERKVCFSRIFSIKSSSGC